MALKNIILVIITMLSLGCRKSNFNDGGNKSDPDSLLGWKVVATIPGESLEDIRFTSPSTGYVIGSAIYRSIDGGDNWKQSATTTGLGGFLNLFFLDEQYGYAQGASILASTVNGGVSWTIKPLVSGDALTLFFTNPSVGFYGDQQSLRRTTNAGDTWSSIFTDPNAPCTYYPWFFNSDSGVVATGSGLFAVTSDGGQNWQSTPGVLPADNSRYAYNQLYFLDRDNGFYACPAGVLKTTDGGIVWRKVLIDTTLSSTINTIMFTDRNTGYYKSVSVIYRSSDGGETWEVDCKLGTDHFFGMHFPDSHHGWACTENGRILKTER